MFFHRTNKWIVAICVSALIFSCFGCNQKLASEPTTATPEQVVADWDACKLYHGLELKEVDLDIQGENDLGNLIFQYSLQETTAETPPEDILYGGPYFRAVFSKDGTTYQWTFNPNKITRTTSIDNTSVTTYYQPDSGLLTSLESYLHR